MATVKNPSIYEDRSTIGSADELDEYGVWVKIEPEELPEAGEERFSGVDALSEPELSPIESDDSVFEDFDFSGEEESPGFDDVEALRQDIQSFSLDEPAKDVAAEPAMPGFASPAELPLTAAEDGSAQALAKIVDALSAIKDDLAAIKEDVAAIRSEKPVRGAGTEDAGFFGEEDDDKIALTGDELDTIIQTAAFAGEAAVPLEGDFVPEGGESEGSLGIDDDLKELRENGVEPMTAAPEDTSYLEEDPLAEEDREPPSAFEEPEPGEGGDASPEEPAPEELFLIDLDAIASGAPPAREEERIEERLFFEDVTFEDLPDLDAPLEVEDMTALENPEEEETIDLSVFEDAFLPGAGDLENAGAPGFEALDESTDQSFEETVQDAALAEDPFEFISLEDEGEIAELTLDQDLEQTLPGDITIDLDLPLPAEELVQDPGEEDDDFQLPGAGEAGEPDASTEGVSPAIKMELRDVLVYMDKLLEALPEEKIDEFVQSEHYATYKRLFEELGIQQ
jgi:hypothetical protein